MACFGAILTGAMSSAEPMADLAAARAVEAQRVTVVERISTAVVAVFGAGAEGGGSGVLITPDGYALTNYHVVSGTGLAIRCGLNDGRAYDAVLVGLDPTGDVALIKLLGREDFPHVPPGDSSRVAVGDPTWVLGNPLMLADDFRPTVTSGVISGVGRYQFPAGTFLEYTDALQTDAAINPGNSGGPLFNAQGELIGINGRASFEKRGRVSVGVGYAISMRQISHFLGHLRGGRLVDHASWGTAVASDGAGGIGVSEQLDDCDAQRRGLRVGDAVMEFAGREVRTPNALKNVLGIYPAGWRVNVMYRRDEDEPKSIEVVLDPLHSTAELTQQVDTLLRSTPRQPLPGVPRPRATAEPGQKPATLPESIRSRFEPRLGFVNYFFNRIERKRVWDRWHAAGATKLAGPWQLEVAGEKRASVSFRIAADELTVAVGARSEKIAEADYSDRLGLATRLADLEAESGLPIAVLAEGISLWQRLAQRGLDEFGEVNYLGTIPPPGDPRPVDVLDAFRGSTPCWFYFADDGPLLAVEWAADTASDRWQLGIEPSQGREFPTSLNLGRGGEVLIRATVRNWHLATGDTP